MQPKFCLLIVAFTFVFSILKAETRDSGTQFRIVAYYSMQSAMTKDFKDVPFDKLTHINLYFLNPDSSGNYDTRLSALIPFVNAAHDKNVNNAKVYFYSS